MPTHPPHCSHMGIRAESVNRHHFCEQRSSSWGCLAQGWGVHAVAGPPARPLVLPLLPTWHHLHCWGLQCYMSKLNPGDWFCWEDQFNAGSSTEGVWRSWLGALRDDHPPAPQVPCWGDAAAATMVPVGPTPGLTTGRGEGRYLLTGSTGSGRPAAWLGFCLGGYLRVFSRVCQPWPPPCFHKCPLRKELVVLSHGADAISTGEVPPWRLGCRQAVQRQSLAVLGTRGQPHPLSVPR